MVKKDEQDQAPKRVLATGASGDPEHPEIGVPSGSQSFFDSAPVTETVTEAKQDKKKGKDE